METCEIPKNNPQQLAERPYSEERIEVLNEQSILTGTYTLASGKNEKFKAHVRKPDKKDEIMILVCILKKGLKILSCHGQNQSCPTAAKIIEKNFSEMDTLLDNFKKKFVRVYCGKNNICCYSKLLMELVITRCKFVNEMKRVYGMYKGKIDIINCVSATFRSLEIKICAIMSRVDETDDCDQSCYKEETTAFYGKCRISGSSNDENSKETDDKCKMNNEIENFMCCGSKREKSLCVLSGKKASEERSDCKVPCAKPQVCSVGINADKVEPKPTFDLTLDYSKYRTDHDDSSEEETDYFVQNLPQGYMKSKIDKKNGRINLSVKCITLDENSSLLKPHGKCNVEQLKKTAEDLLNIFNMSKLWLNSGKEVCQQMLCKR